jgi:AcrR family transcriptional regulator
MNRRSEHRARRPLTRKRILNAALRIVDSRGLPALSMRMLGQRLGVEAMSLYYYFPNKQALLDQLVSDLVRSVPIPDESLPWQEWSKVAARSFYHLYSEHAELLPMFVPQTREDVSSYATGETFLRVMHREGVDPKEALAFLQTFNACAIGFALVRGSADRLPTKPAPSSAAEFLERLQPEMPLVHAAILAGKFLPPDDAFEFALDLLVRGFESRDGKGL